MKSKSYQRKQRHMRVKKSLISNKGLHRLVVFRSNKYIYGQIIDDQSAKTIVAASDLKSKEKNKIERAKIAGQELAKESVKKNVKKVVFDRGGYRFHGRVKAFAQGAREGGLTF